MAGWSFVADLPAGLWGKEKREIRGSSTQQQRKRLYLDLYNSIFIIWYLWGRLFFTWCLDYSFVHRLDGFVAHGAPVGTARNKRTCQKKKNGSQYKVKEFVWFFFYSDWAILGLFNFSTQCNVLKEKHSGPVDGTTCAPGEKFHRLFLYFSLKEQIEVEFNCKSDFILNFWI